MRKYLTLLFAGFIFLLMFATPETSVKAAENEDCACHDVTPILGAEKNKIIADLISSEEFKQIKKSTKSDYSLNGVHDIEVVKLNQLNIIMVGVPFSKNDDGNVYMFAFMGGHFLGITPLQ
ncbi:MAG TPA: hypothetical protein VJ546_03940 [Bacillales bacterium]|nr:hypothetical protein [Bacillales bacterium]